MRVKKEPQEEKKISRKKVLRGLNACKFGPMYPDCKPKCSAKVCPYYRSTTCDQDLFSEAIALIEQDEKELKELRKQE